jgi:hypothetical protein
MHVYNKSLFRLVNSLYLIIYIHDNSLKKLGRGQLLLIIYNYFITVIKKKEFFVILYFKVTLLPLNS